MLLGILATFALPKIKDYRTSACNKKLQAEVLGFKLALNHQLTKELPIDFESLYKTLDLTPSQCYFAKQKNGFIGINGDKKVYFSIKKDLLQCDYTKSTRLGNNESYCDIFH